MVVLAVCGDALKLTGLLQDVPLEAPAVGDTEKPLSVAIRPFVTFTAEPISA